LGGELKNNCQGGEIEKEIIKINKSSEELKNRIENFGEKLEDLEGLSNENKEELKQIFQSLENFRKINNETTSNLKEKLLIQEKKGLDIFRIITIVLSFSLHIYFLINKMKEYKKINKIIEIKSIKKSVVKKKDIKN
jgi:hypothetical protein